MKKDTLIDYAHPCMMAEAALKRLHNLMLENKYDEALAAGMEAIQQTRATLYAVSEMKQRSNKNKSTTKIVEPREF